MTEELYSVDQVAARLGLHVRTVRNYVRNGRLRAVRIGKQYRIAREDLEALTGRAATSARAESETLHRHVEVSSIVQIEAMAAGLPVVNTRLDSGVPFVSLDQQTGLTVPPEDPDALADALNRLLDDRNLRQSLGRAASVRARQEFSLERMMSRTMELYKQIAGQPLNIT